MADPPIDDIPKRVKQFHIDLCLELSDSIFPGSNVWNDLLIQIKVCLQPAEIARFKTPPDNHFSDIWDKLQEKGIIRVGDYGFLVENFTKRNYIPLVDIINKGNKRIHEEWKLSLSPSCEMHKTGE